MQANSTVPSASAIDVSLEFDLIDRTLQSALKICRQMEQENSDISPRDVEVLLQHAHYTLTDIQQQAADYKGRCEIGWRRCSHRGD